MGGANVAERTYFNYSRGQEQSADQAAVRFLDKAGFSSRGMLDFLKVLSGQELLHSNQQDPYMLTHPLTSGRIAFVRHHVANSRFSNQPTPTKFSILHRRLVAKLDGYIDAPSATFRRYPDTDNSVAALYARCLAYFRHGNLKKAKILVDELTSREPKNPYFFELKGQMMFENGRINKALRSYRKAVRLLPNAPLLRTALAHVELETNRPDLIDDVIRNTEVAVRMDPLISLAWRLNGVAHGRKGKMGLSSLSLAEYNLLIDRKAQAAALAKRAMRLLSTGQPAWLRAQDIDNQVNQNGN